MLITPPGDNPIPCLIKWKRDLNLLIVKNYTHSTSPISPLCAPELRRQITKFSPAGTKPLPCCIKCFQHLRTYAGDVKQRRAPSCTYFGLPRTEVRRITQKFTDHVVPDDPAFFLMHAMDTPSQTYKTSVVRHLLDEAKACIPLYWKSQHPRPLVYGLKRWMILVEWRTY